MDADFYSNGTRACWTSSHLNRRGELQSLMLWPLSNLPEIATTLVNSLASYLDIDHSIAKPISTVRSSTVDCLQRRLTLKSTRTLDARTIVDECWIPKRIRSQPYTGSTKQGAHQRFLSILRSPPAGNRKRTGQEYEVIFETIKY